MSATSEHLAASVPFEQAQVQTPFRRFLSDFFESKVAMTAFAMLVVIIFIALFAPLISPQNPYDLAVVDVMNARLEPGEQSWSGDLTFVLGSDGAGRTCEDRLITLDVAVDHRAPANIRRQRHAADLGQHGLGVFFAFWPSTPLSFVKSLEQPHA